MSTPRFLAEGRAFYHCMSRVVDRRFVFSVEEKRVFRKVMRLLERFMGVRVVTYCLMSNHFHLLLEVPDREELEPLTIEELLELVPQLHDPAAADRIKEEIKQAQEWDRLHREWKQSAKERRERGEEGTLEDMGGIAMAFDDDGDVRGSGLVENDGAHSVSGSGAPGDEADGSAVRAILARYERRRGDLSIFMRELKQRVTFYMNKRLDRVGTLWESRFKSVLIEGEAPALMAVAAYIDLNPVRAGIVSRPEDYAFSGYGEALSSGKAAAQARVGLGRILRRGLGRLGQDAAATGESWQATLNRYRFFLYEQGIEIAGDSEGGVEGRRGIPKEEVEAVRDGAAAKSGACLAADADDEGDRSETTFAEVPALAGLAGLAVSVGGVLRSKPVRYFSDGAVFGSAGFVEEVFKREKSAGRFGRSRRTGARRLRGGDWGALRVLRDLRKGTPTGTPTGPGQGDGRREG